MRLKTLEIFLYFYRLFNNLNLFLYPLLDFNAHIYGFYRKGYLDCTRRRLPDPINWDDTHKCNRVWAFADVGRNQEKELPILTLLDGFLLIWIVGFLEGGLLVWAYFYLKNKRRKI